jgi:two-component system phosphate regulon sensor histidine kinase PhoR
MTRISRRRRFVAAALAFSGCVSLAGLGLVWQFRGETAGGSPGSESSGAAVVGLLAMAGFSLAVSAVLWRREWQEHADFFQELLARLQTMAGAPSPTTGTGPGALAEHLTQAIEALEYRFADREIVHSDEQRRIQTVLASLVEGVIAVDADLRIAFINHRAIEILGVQRGQIQGCYVGEIVRIPAFDQAVRTVHASVFPSEVEFETHAPRRRAVVARITPLAPPLVGGKPSEISSSAVPGSPPATELAIVLYDVTELRRLERIRRDFVANVSHELKTPLAAIRAYAETLRLGAIDDVENNRNFVEQIEIQAELLEQQVRDLLHLARVESGSEALELSAIDLDEASQQCLERFQDEADRRGIQLRRSPAQQPIFAIADREAVATILDNLVSNAIRYTRAGGWVRIQAAYEGNFASINVADNGIGIAAEHQSRIFERFYRVDKARSRDVGGTGLGLAIVKHTVQALDGEIHLTSAVGRGSSFRVSLPHA